MAICRHFQQGYCKYGQHCRFEHVYGSKYTYRASQNTNQNDSYQSRHSGNNYPSNNSASSIFRNAVQNNNTASEFGQNQRPASVFNRLGPQSNAPNQNQKAQSLFAQANQNIYRKVNTSVSNVENPFSQSQQSNAKSLFAQATQNIFGENQNNIFLQNNSDPKNIFATAARTVISSQNPFSIAPENIHKELPNVFGNLNNSFNKNNYGENEYSKMEDLSPNDVEAFGNSEFKLYFIPEIPPPKSLCV